MSKRLSEQFVNDYRRTVHDYCKLFLTSVELAVHDYRKLFMTSVELSMTIVNCS